MDTDKNDGNQESTNQQEQARTKTRSYMFLFQ
jgi:hypothetical protein